MAAALLRSGETPQRVAARSRVPLALIELIADEISITEAAHATEVDETDTDRAMTAVIERDAAVEREAHLAAARAAVRWGRRRVLLARMVLVALAVNLAASITADLGHHHLLGVVSVVLAPTLVLGLLWSLTRPARRRPRRPPG